MAMKQTAGRETLGKFAPKFAQLNDDVLFGEVWSREAVASIWKGKETKTSAQPTKVALTWLAPYPPKAMRPMPMAHAEARMTSHQGAEAGSRKARSSPVMAAVPLS